MDEAWGSLLRCTHSHARNAAEFAGCRAGVVLEETGKVRRRAEAEAAAHFRKAVRRIDDCADRKLDTEHVEIDVRRQIGRGLKQPVKMRARESGLFCDLAEIDRSSACFPHHIHRTAHTP